ELIGMPFDKIIVPINKEGDEIELEKLIKEAADSVVNFETTYITKDGREIPVNFSASVMRDEEGRLQGIVCDGGNITERKRAEEALRRSEQKFKDLTETTTDWVWEADAEGVYTYASPKIKDLLGYEVSEVLGKTPFDLMPKEEAEKISKFFNEKVINKESFFGLDNVNRHKDGHLVVLETSGIPIFDEKGQLKGYRGIDRDITERKRAEKELQESMAELERFNRLAVGRELRMIELKQEGNRLCERLGEKPPYDLSIVDAEKEG
ncbi:MAG: PAS domain-containing protein, partial [Methanophagales archaeon]|nr:PAS domain-containing protein [Methanophagales archaeon]